MTEDFNKDIEDHDTLLFSEHCLTNNRKVRYVKQGTHVIRKGSTFNFNIISALQNLLFEIFLPRGYPDSVSEDYTWYQVWDTLQACCSTLSGMLAVQAVLMGVGVGQDSATPLAAALAWFTKDGVGMVTGIGFAWIKGTSLDSDCKKWRLFADGINDAALCLELSISVLLDRAVPLLCLSSALKAVVGVAGGATRAALTHHQATRGNTADVAAKDGSQETLVNLTAMSFGIWSINTELVQRNIWFVMSLLVFLHLYCNFRAVKSLRLKKMNEQRYLITLTGYLQTGQVPTVTAVNLKESVILGFGSSATNLCGFSISLGESLEGRVPSSTELQSLLVSCRGRRYLLVPEFDLKRISIALQPNIIDRDVLKAYFHAVLLAHLINKDKMTPVPNTPLANVFESSKKFKSGSLDGLRAAILCCEETVDLVFDNFAKLCESEGWNLTEHVLRVDQWRVEWEEKERRED